MRRTTSQVGASKRAASRSGLGPVLFRLVMVFMRRGSRETSLTAVSVMSGLDKNGPQRITDLAMFEGVTHPSMTGLVSTLEKAGLVERRGNPADRRVTLVALTPAGARAVRIRRESGADAFERLIEKLSPDEVALLAAAVPAIEHLCQLSDPSWHTGEPSFDL
jgi:DNA-binding MarR family transcriptional regulator